MHLQTFTEKLTATNLNIRRWHFIQCFVYFCFQIEKGETITTKSPTFSFILCFIYRHIHTFYIQIFFGFYSSLDEQIIRHVLNGAVVKKANCEYTDQFVFGYTVSCFDFQKSVFFRWTFTFKQITPPDRCFIFLIRLSWSKGWWKCFCDYLFRVLEALPRQFVRKPN